MYYFATDFMRMSANKVTFVISDISRKQEVKRPAATAKKYSVE